MSITGRHVIIVEDIMDSGLTLNHLTSMLRAREPASLKIVALLDKPERRECAITPDYYGLSFLMNLSWDTVLTMPAHIETCLLLVFLRTRFTLIKH